MWTIQLHFPQRLLISALGVIHNHQRKPKASFMFGVSFGRVTTDNRVTENIGTILQLFRRMSVSFTDILLVHRDKL